MADVDDDLWHHYRRHSKSYSVEKGILKMGELTVVPRTALSSLLFILHDSPLSGHLGRNRTWDIVKDRFWWPNSYTDVRDYINSCTTCQARKVDANKRWSPLSPSQTMDYPMERMAMDIFQMPKCSGYEYVLVVVDYFSKWVEAFPLRSKTAETVSWILFNEVFMRWGTPVYLHSDRGSEFVARVTHDLTRLASVYQTHTPAYAPRSDGQAERQIRTVKDMLSKYYAEHGKWYPYLQPALCAIRTTVHETIGFSPFEVMFGRQPRLMVDLKWGMPASPKQKHPTSWNNLQARLRHIYRDVRERQTLKSERMKERYDSSKKMGSKIFQPGQWVWVRARQGPRPKILPKWTGPHLVVDVNEYGTVYVNRSKEQIKIAQDRCKLYCERPSHLQSAEYKEAFAKASVDYECDPPKLILNPNRESDLQYGLRFTPRLMPPPVLPSPPPCYPSSRHSVEVTRRSAQTAETEVDLADATRMNVEGTVERRREPIERCPSPEIGTDDQMIEDDNVDNNVDDNVDNNIDNNVDDNIEVEIGNVDTELIEEDECVEQNDSAGQASEVCQQRDAEAVDRSQNQGGGSQSVRKSARTRAEPERLRYDQSFKQISAIGTEDTFWTVSVRSPEDLGISLRNKSGTFLVRRVVPGKIAAGDRLCKAGDKLISVNYRPVRSWKMIQSAIKANINNCILTFAS